MNTPFWLEKYTPIELPNVLMYIVIEYADDLRRERFFRAFQDERSEKIAVKYEGLNLWQQCCGDVNLHYGNFIHQFIWGNELSHIYGWSDSPTLPWPKRSVRYWIRQVAPYKTTISHSICTFEKLWKDLCIAEEEAQLIKKILSTGYTKADDY